MHIDKHPVRSFDFRQLLQQYLKLIRPQNRQFLLAGTLITFIQAIAILESVLFGKIVEVALRRGPNAISQLKQLGFGACILILSGTLLTAGKSIVLRRAIISTVDNLWQLCLRKITRLNGPYLETNNSTNLFGRIVKGIDRTEGLSWQLAHELLPLALTFIGTLIAVILIVPTALLALIPAVTSFTLLTVWTRSKFAHQRQWRHVLKRDGHSLFGEIVNNLRTILVFNQQERLLKRHHDLEQSATRALYEEYDFYDRVDAVRGAIIGGTRLAILVIPLAVGWNNPSLGGQILVLSLLSERLLRACYSIGSIYDRFIDACEPIQEMTDVLNEPELVLDPEQATPYTDRRGEVAFRDLCFAYPSNPDHPALQDVTFTIGAGETVGIVGESGSGKSTIVKLLPRFMDPSSGAVLLDGHDLRMLRQEDIRQVIGYVPQHVDIFDTSILENIRFGAPDASEAEVVEAAKLAHAHGFISSFRDGYATRVGDRGLRLSGGQIQRIGLARVLLCRPQVILLDEATASVDVHNDIGIHQSIKEIAKTGRTVIIIAHRLSTVKEADRIICLDKGRVVEIGTPAALRERSGGYYSALLRAQAIFDSSEDSAPN